MSGKEEEDPCKAAQDAVEAANAAALAVMRSKSLNCPTTVEEAGARAAATRDYNYENAMAQGGGGKRFKSHKNKSSIPKIYLILLYHKYT